MCRIAPIWLPVFGLLVAASPAGAATKDWSDVSGNWANGGSWTPIGVPAAVDTVNIVFGDDVARTVTYDYTGPDITLGTLTLDMIGPGSNGVTLSMAANSLKTSATTIGADGRATFNLTGGSLTGGLVVGSGGIGTFDQSGGSVSATPLNIGSNSGGFGTYSLSAGTLNVTDESVAAGAVGNATQSGGTFLQTGGTHNVNRLSVGRLGGSNGTFTLGGGSLVTATDVFVGEDGNGVFGQTGGVHSVAGNLNVASNPGSAGSYTANAALNAANIYVGGRPAGAGGTGTFSVSGSNAIVTVPGTIKIYNTAGNSFGFSSGTVNVGAINVNGVSSLFNWTGGTLNITNDLALDSGAAPTSTTAAFGSSLSLSSTKILKVTGNETIGGTGTFNLSLGSSGSGAAAHVVTGNVTLKPGGTISGSGGNLMCASLIQAGGSINGTFRNLSTFTYQSGSFSGTLINNGTVTFGSALSVNTLQNEASMTISAGQLLSTTGSGITNSGTLTANAGSISTGTFTNTGNTTFNAGGFTSFSTTITNSGSFVMNGGSIPSGSVTNSGTFVQNGGTISVNTFTNSVSGNMTAHGLFGGQLVNHGTLTVDGAFTFTNSFTATQDGVVQGVGTISNSTGFASFNNSAGGVINSITPNGTLVINNLSTNNAGAVVNVGPTSTLSLASGNGTGGWTNSGTATLQGSGARLTGGVMTLQNGGIVQGAGMLVSTLGTSNNGVFRASGGDLLFAQPFMNSSQSTVQVLGGSSATFLQGMNTNSGQVSLVGGTFDNTGKTLSNQGTINGYGTLRTGGLTNNSTRLISVGEGDMNVFGNVTNNGVISIQNGRSAYFWNNVSGSGSFTGTGTAVFLASLSPGNSPASVNFAGGVTLSTALAMELGGTTAGSQYDQIHVGGQLAVGGTLAVSLINGFKPAIGNTFDLLDWGLLNGTFLSIMLPTLTGAQWDTSQLYTTGVLSVVAGPGDFNADGAVDAADYVLWRKGLGTTYTQNDYTAWRSNFGQSSGSGAAWPENSPSAVPEPHSTLLLLFGLGCCAARRRRSSVVEVISP